MQLPLKIDHASTLSLQAQIVEQIRDAILRGQLKPGTRMAGTRTLSQQLGVSRNTALLAYERLAAEGYLQTDRACRTFVSFDIPEECLRSRALAEDGNNGTRAAVRLPPAFRGRRHMVVNPRRSRLATDFWVGRPDARSFPLRVWRRLLMRNLVRAWSNLTEYGQPAGLLELRRAIADYLGPARGITATPEQVVIVAGCQQGLDLVARLLLGPDSRCVVESPCYQGAAFLFESYGAAIDYVPVRDDGIDTALLPAGPAAIAYVTPSHQYPLGVTMSLERRLRLLEWARRTGSYIIEDDYDSDFRYQGSPLTALKGLDRCDCVIYLGTFSKSLGAGLRLGYLVLPRELAEPAATIKALTDNGNPWLEQAALAELIHGGSYDAHLRRIRQTYLHRRNCLIECLGRHFGPVRLSGLDGGMHLVWHLPPDFPPAAELQALALAERVGIYTLSSGAAYEPRPSEWTDRVIMLGYSSVNERQIADGIARIAAALGRSRRPAAGADRPSQVLPAAPAV